LSGHTTAWIRIRHRDTRCLIRIQVVCLCYCTRGKVVNGFGRRACLIRDNIVWQTHAFTKISKRNVWSNAFYSRRRQTQATFVHETRVQLKGVISSDTKDEPVLW